MQRIGNERNEIKGGTAQRFSEGTFVLCRIYDLGNPIRNPSNGHGAPDRFTSPKLASG
jgi:hypothetical protein